MRIADGPNSNASWCTYSVVGTPYLRFSLVPLSFSNKNALKIFFSFNFCLKTPTNRKQWPKAAGTSSPSKAGPSTGGTATSAPTAATAAAAATVKQQQHPSAAAAVNDDQERDWKIGLF